MSLERILKRMVKGLFRWWHQGSGINYHSRSGFYYQRQFLRLIFMILRLIFLSVHMICSGFFLLVDFTFYL